MGERNEGSAEDGAMTMRPTYENGSTLAEEIAIAKEVGELWDVNLTKMPRAYRLDFSIRNMQGRFKAWTEIKRRFHKFDTYPNTFLSLGKVFAAREFNEYTELPCLFIVKFDDCIAYADMLPKRELFQGGRNDRDDWQDQEPLVLVPKSDFTVVIVIKPKEEVV
jgi:hypothetical protein